MDDTTKMPDTGQIATFRHTPVGPAIRTGAAGPATSARTVLFPPPKPAQPAVRPAAVPPPQMKPVAGAARTRLRHWALLASFILVVLVPTALTGAYLWGVAKDEFASSAAFSVRREDGSSSTIDLLGGITKIAGGGGGSGEAEAAYQFIRSQEIVESIDRKIDLRAIYSREWPADPLFAFDPSGTIEDLQRYWNRVVTPTYDSSNHIIGLRVVAFTPDDALKVSRAIIDETTLMINALSDEARRDATHYAGQELGKALDRLKTARQAITEFRLRTQIVDPAADLQGQMGVITTLQGQLAEAMVQLDLLKETARTDDPRISQVTNQISVIERRIAEERRKFGIGGQGPGGADYATLVNEYERLAVDLEFAEKSYLATQAAYDVAQADALRRSSYLAAHIAPTLAQRALYPERWTYFGLTAFFLMMAWSIGALVYYSVRDRR